MYDGIFNTISRVWYFLKYQYLKFIWHLLSDQIIGKLLPSFHQ